jgi:hypothetical protein
MTRESVFWKKILHAKSDSGKRILGQPDFPLAGRFGLPDFGALWLAFATLHALTFGQLQLGLGMHLNLV